MHASASKQDGKDLIQLYKSSMRYSLKRSRNQQKSPVYSLPDDVLRQIFEEVYVHQSLVTPCRSAQNPLYPSHVSRRWRTVALSLPRLWRCMHLSYKPQLLSLWLERSVKLPIYIVCTDEDLDKLALGRDSHTQDSHSTARLRLLAAHAARWHMCAITANLHLAKVFFNAIRDLPLPYLETYSFSYHDFSHPYEECVGLPLSQRIHTLSLKHIRPSHTIFSSLSSLRRLQLSSQAFPGYYLTRIAEAAPQLVELILYDVRPKDDDPYPSAYFRCLRVLKLYNSRFPYLLHYLDAPLLETLFFEDLGPSPATPFGYPGMAHNPGRLKLYPVLRRLHLTVKVVDRLNAGGYPERDHFLQQTPGVTNLEVTHSDFSGILSDLLNPEHKLAPLPELRSVTVGELPYEDSHAMLLDLVLLRARSETPLREIKLDWRVYGCLAPQIVRTLRKYVTVSVVDTGVLPDLSRFEV